MKHKNNNNYGAKRRKRRSGREVRPQFIGRVQMTRDGFIFVLVEGQEEDIFVRAAKTRNALDADTVRVAVTKEAKEGSRREGEVVEIIERSGKQFVGTLHFVGAQAWVLMQSKNMPYDIAVDQQEALSMGGQSGMKVAVVVDRWERHDPAPFGHLVDILGKPGENDTEMHAILAEFNLPYRFEKEVEDAADSISEKISRDDLKGRQDFRDTLTFTIDPTDAKDFDDALSFRKLNNGNYEVGVHIADVTWYVKPGTAVDKEARERGTSVYLVDRTVPMLPEKLCNKLCSLRPKEDKLTFSTIFEVTPQAKVLKSKICRTIINSDYRLDYEGAQKIIDGAEDNTAPAELKEAVLILNDLASKMKARQFKAGAINFDRPEMKVDIDEKGRPIGVHQHISTEANWLIEEWMLEANKTVAAWVSGQGKTFVYRIHGEPDLMKLGNLRGFAKGFGYKMGDKLEGRDAAKAITSLLADAAGKPECQAFQDIALRAMAKACYSTENIGHYGLAFKDYTHFTSPIRRYPDMMVHRLLTDYLDKKQSRNKEEFETECKHASQRELVAADAERTSTKYKLVEFMMDKVGQEFEGHISGVTEWGMYVAIEPTQIEGMIPLREIRSDFFEYDEKLFRLVGRRTHKVFRYGDPVKVKVKAANLEQRQLDYELVEDLDSDRTPVGNAEMDGPVGHVGKVAKKKAVNGKAAGRVKQLFKRKPKKDKNNA